MKTEAIEQLFNEKSTNPKKIEYANRRLNKLLELIDVYKQEGELIKKEFKDVRDAMSRLYDEARSFEIGLYSIKPRIPYETITRSEEAIDDIPLDKRGINKYLKALKAVNPDNEKPEVAEYVAKALPVMEELAELQKEVEQFKDLVVAKKKADVKKAESVAKEEAKKADHADVKRVKAFLVELTEGGRDKIYQEILEYDRKIQQRKIDYLESVNNIIPQYVRRTEPQPRYGFAELRPVMDNDNPYKNGEPGSRTYVINVADPEVLQERLETEAEKQTSALIAQYVFRVADKLAYIISRKDCLDDIKCSELNLTHAIEANLDLTFKDGSSFTLVTTTEIHSNPVNPGYHIKIPSRFTNVVRADGSKVKNPSEKLVQDELAP